MHVLVVGFGVSGRGAARLLLKQGISVTAVDRNAARLRVQPGIQLKSEEECPEVTSFDALVLSPGVPQTHPFCLAAKRGGIPIVGEVELACQQVNCPIFAVTGTNGKTTVTSLVAHVARESGLSAAAVGNIGVPLSEVLSQSFDLLVLELSSYQLETLATPIIDAAVILNITPDHLDRYDSLECYARAKISIERSLKSGGALYTSEQVWDSYSSLFENKPLLFEQTLLIREESLYWKGELLCTVPLQYRNLPVYEKENLLAAFSLCLEAGLSCAQVWKAYATFRKPPHRLEFVREVRGVSYYNDSKGTNSDAVLCAARSFSKPIFLIAGGQSKGNDFSTWCEELPSHVQQILAVGEAQEEIVSALGSSFSVVPVGTIAQALSTAFSLAREGDVVLLSPGCASFDQFRNYEERGNYFKQIVHQL